MVKCLRNTRLWLRALNWHQTYWKIACKSEYWEHKVINSWKAGRWERKRSVIKLLALSIHRELCFVFKFQFKLTPLYFVICVCKCVLHMSKNGCGSQRTTRRSWFFPWPHVFLGSKVHVSLTFTSWLMLEEFGILSWEVSAFFLYKVVKVLRKRNNFFRFVFQKVASGRKMK